MSEFLCWSCKEPVRGSATNRKAVPENERAAQQKAGTPISDDARCHESCAVAIRKKYSAKRKAEAEAPVASRMRSKGGPEALQRPAAGGWGVAATEAAPVFDSRTRGGAGSSAEAAEEMQGEPVDEPMLPGDLPPPPRVDRATELESSATTCTGVVPEVLQPTPQQLGGAVNAMKAAAIREQTGAPARAAPLSPEERVAVASRCPWDCLDLQEARTRGAAEAAERKRLAKRVTTLEEQKSGLEQKVESLNKERAELAVFKQEVEKAEKERQRALKQRKGKGQSIDTFEAARKICLDNGLQCAAPPSPVCRRWAGI